jgi:hypothetical protein
LVDDAVMVDEERHHPRLPIIGGPGNHRKAADEMTVDNVAVVACRGRGALSR